MMKYVALLSGENAGFSVAELEAYVKHSFGSSFRKESVDGRVVVFSAREGIDFSGLALTHEVSEYFGNDVELKDMKKFSSNVLVRGVKVDTNRSASVIEKKTGKKITEFGHKVDFGSSEVLRIYVTENEYYFSKLIAEVDRKDLRKRDAKHRPYFQPGTINAIEARSFVNVLGCVKEDVVCDPFCGSGAFLIEAGLRGMKVFGCDISFRHVNGCIENLSNYGIPDHDIRNMDCLELLGAGLKFDGVVSDLPWGKSTLLGCAKEELFSKFFEMLPHILKKGKFAAVACDIEDMDRFIPENMKVVHSFELFVHRSKKRYLWVLLNP